MTSKPLVWGAAALVVALLAMLLVACSGSPGSLQADTRVRILEPKPGSTVNGPVVIRWSSTFEPGEASGRWFVVYVDAAPIPPAQSALVAAAHTCDTVPACLAAGEIDGPNVFLTDAHSVDVGALPAGAGPEHRFTIVLVDKQGVRDGDVAWTASFRVEPT
jgi:hypothetical protein